MANTSWRKSSASSSSGATSCVEVKFSLASVRVRDSKHRLPALRFPTTTWRLFINQIDPRLLLDTAGGS